MKKPLIYTLRAKINMVVLGISIFLLVFAYFYGIRVFNSYIDGEFYNRVEAKLDTAILVYSSEEEKLLNLASYIGDSNTVKATLEIGLREQLANYIKKILTENNLSFLTITDENGKVVVRATDFYSFGDVLDYPIIKNIIEKKEGPVLTRMTFTSEDLAKEKLLSLAEIKVKENETLDKGLMITLAVPIFSGDKFLGTAFFGRLLNNNLQLAESIKKIINEDIHIVQNETVVASTLSDFRGLLLKKEAGGLPQSIKLGNEDYFLVYYPLEDLKGESIGLVALSTSIKEVETIKTKTRNSFILMFLFTLILLAFFSFYTARFIADPIHKIVKAMVAVAGGDLNQTAAVKTKDEIGELSQAFNEMTMELKKSKELSEETKATLEIKVEARTKELKSLTESLEGQVKERTKELQKRIADLEKFYKLTVGRELKMIELKKEIEKLKKELENHKRG